MRRRPPEGRRDPETPDDLDPIDAYLDELTSRLRGPASRVRRVLLEAESHLRDAAEADATADGGVAPAGTDDDAVTSDTAGTVAAQRRAIAAFGAPAQVARAHNRAQLRPAVLAGPLGLAVATLTGVGLLAMGVSAVILRFLTGALGRTTMFADPPGTHYSAGSCAYWLHLHPAAGSCSRAVLLEAADDAVVQRAAAGVLGLLLLAGVTVVRRRRPGWRSSAVPSTLVPGLGVLAFAIAAVALIGIGLDRIAVSQGRGAGMWLTDGSVSAVAAAGCAALLMRELLGTRRRPA